jgi:polyisoprenoid-binding protein YceI
MRKAVLAMAMVAAAGWAQLTLADSYQVDPVHSSIVFEIGHLQINHVYGRFNGATGLVDYDAAAPEKTRIDVQVEAKNVDTNVPQRDMHLRSATFFDAEKYPTIQFKSTSVKAAAGGALEVTGDLTLHGVTKPVTVTLKYGGVATDPRMGTRAGFETQFTIKRSDFGMTNMIPMVGDEAKLMVALEGVKQR